jgi:GTPase SAR1 family protein
MVKAYRKQASKPDKRIWVFADLDFRPLESQITLKPISATSITEDVYIAVYEGTEQEIEELITKLQTEPFKSKILKITDDKRLIFDATKPTLFGTTVYQVKRQCIRILREQSRINPIAERAEEVYHWASLLTAESRYTDNEEEYNDYYLTEAGQRLKFKLTHMPAGEIVGLVGLQGVGKTSMLKKMAHDLNTKETPIFFIHWTPDWYEKLKQNPEIKKEYHSFVKEALLDKVHSYGSQFRRMAALGGKIPNRDTSSHISDGGMPLETMEGALTKAECRMAMESAINYTLPYLRYLFIDLPDYDRRAMSSRNEDLQSIEAIWKRAIDTAGSEMRATIVLGIQKETFGGHFFYGKMHIVDLKPMTREEMIPAYKHKWKTTAPFTEEALGLLADFSRGIFRRFLRYIAKSVETACTRKEFPITVEAVNASVTLETLIEDMNQEMAKIFKNNEEQKMLAVKLLTLLRQKPNLNQKDIAEALQASEDVIGMILKKLSLYSYVKNERGERRELKWSLT